jgi:predicted Zn-dependent peptidase
MVEFKRFQLANGLRVLINEDHTTPLVAINILYFVGSRNEQPDKTGFAHLFEHLMFGGSVNIPSFDEPLQMVGGENNAFTSNDITNYYITLPADNIETGLWLESDRMLSLDFSAKSLKVQKNVVMEEFRQRYLNQPYGDIWLLLRPLAYKVHPYRWPTIGEKMEHIRDATLRDVKSFFNTHYSPGNAYMAISGNISHEEGFRLVEKWFGELKPGSGIKQEIACEPVQTEERVLRVTRKVPFDALYKAWHMPCRLDKGFYVCDMLTDLLSSGKSSRLYQILVKEKKLFSEVNAFVSGDFDPGILVIGGKIMENVPVETANQAILDILKDLSETPVSERELKKIQNKYETNLLLSHTHTLNKAMSLSYFEMLGDANLINDEIGKFCAITPEDVISTAKSIFTKENCSTLYYLAEKN